jgi:7,8-dihydroneopterin aldolase/epimerase/oxygenase
MPPWREPELIMQTLKATPLQSARSAAPLYRVFIRDLVLSMSIGVHPHEKHAPQRVRINVELDVQQGAARLEDDLRNVVCYDELIQAVQKLGSGPHIQLAETMAERILELCLADERVRRASVTVEKLDVYEAAGAVGVTMVRENL